jgi:proline iminopeptidase
MIPVDGKYKVWTKKLGSGPIKMLTLHGGPGFGHEYFECFEDFLPQAGVEFYYYDQLGSFYSDQPDDVTLTVDRFRDEVEQVRAALGPRTLPVRAVTACSRSVCAEIPEPPEGPSPA